MAEEEVGLRLSLKDRRETAAGLAAVRGDLDGVGRSADTAGRRARTGAAGFEAMRRSGRLAAAGIKLAFAGALAAGYAATRLLSSAFDEAREAQKVGALTRSVIKSTGGAANVTARQVERLSGRLSKMAGIDDELIQTGANLLLTFKNVRNEVGKGNNVFDRATEAAVNLSAAGFGSVDSASKMLGKALNDPVKGLTAMGRAGVTFSAQQQEQIKGFVEQNDLLSAQKIILGEVQSQVGGAARSQRTWGDVARVTWGNILERIGTGLLPLLDRFNRWFVQKGAPQLDKYLGLFESEGVPALSRFARKGQAVAERILPKITDVLGTAKDLLVDAAPYAERLLNAFTGMPSWAKKAIVGGGLAAYAGNKTGLNGVVGSLVRGGGSAAGSLLGSAKPVPVFVTNPGFGDGVGGGKGSPVVGGAKGLGSKIGFGAPGAAAATGAGVAAGVTAVLAGGALMGYAEAEALKAYDKTVGKWTFDFLAGKDENAAARAASTASAAANNAKNYTSANATGGVGSNPGVPANAEGIKDYVAAMNQATRGPAADYFKAIEGGVYRTDRALTTVAGKAAAFGSTLDGVGKKRVEPTFATPTLPGTQSRTNKYAELLGEVAKPVSTDITAPGLLGIIGNLGAATRAADNLARDRTATITIYTRNVRQDVPLPGGGSAPLTGGTTSGGNSGRKAGRAAAPRAAFSAPSARFPVSALPDPGPADRELSSRPLRADINIDGRHILTATVNAIEDREARS